MVNKAIDIKTLNLEELTGVVSIYPWYGAARKELCRRMAELGEGAWSEDRFADAALYIGSRKIVAELAGKGKAADYSDRNIRALLESFLPQSASSQASRAPKVIVAGQDFFSQAQYDSVRTSSDSNYSKFAQGLTGASYQDHTEEEIANFCTETLAQIYLEQGYVEQAKEIYSKLSLLYPEKSVYFASLIEKIEKR